MNGRKQNGTARNKLNSVYLFITLVVAAVIGGAAESWPVFVLVAAALMALLVMGGGVRIGGHGPRRRR